MNRAIGMPDASLGDFGGGQTRSKQETVVPALGLERIYSKHLLGLFLAILQKTKASLSTKALLLVP